MTRLLATLFLSVIALACSADERTAPERDATDIRPEQDSATAADTPSSEQLEKELQELPWGQFRSVISAIPKLKAEVDAYGPLGWKYVRSNYKTYGWKKSVDKLDDAQKGNLADLIRKAKRATARES